MLRACPSKRTSAWRRCRLRLELRLERRREASQRTVCASNLRQLGTVMQLYATEYKDTIPIGYMDQKQFSYVVHWNHGGVNIPKSTQMGLLVESGVIKDGKTFYCPSEQDP